LVSGAATLAARDSTTLTVDATRAGPVLLRVRWTPYWTTTGPACVAPAPGGWTEARFDGPGRLVLGTTLLGAAGHCDP
jgi:hypothetical protein